MKRMGICLLLCLAVAVQVSAQGASQASAKPNGQATKLEGQVVCCAECWARADRTKVAYGTAEDLLRAKDCVEGGDPTLLAVREGERFAFYELEQGKFRLPGKNWLEFVGQRIAVEGAARKKGRATAFRVDALAVLEQSIAEREAAGVVGREIDLTLRDLSGTEQRLSALKGRIVVLNFWATYCEPCRKEMPDLASIQNEYAALGVQVVGASADAGEDRAKVLQFVRETKINFPIWMGAGVADMMRFGLGAALPGTVVVGRDGRVAKIISGVVNPSELKKQIDAMLAAQEAAQALEQRREREGVAAAGRRAEAATVKQKAGEVSSVPS